MTRAAGWHGREIRAPYTRFAHESTPRLPPGWSAGAVQHGTGYGRPSQRVRELQQRLLRRGYRPGPADGRFGPRTRAAVTWFQIKHGLPPTGRGDVRTISRLRDPRRPVQRGAGSVVPGGRGGVAAPPTAGSVALESIATVLLALVILVGFAVIAAWVRLALGSRAEVGAAPTARPAIVGPPDERPAAPTVLGYVALAKGEDLEAATRGDRRVVRGTRLAAERRWSTTRLERAVARACSTCSTRSAPGAWRA